MPELQRAALLASELVTNAVIHGEGKISVRAELDQDRLLVGVIEQGQGFEPAVKEADFEEVGGRGSKIVEAESSRWGIHEARPACDPDSSGRVRRARRRQEAGGLIARCSWYHSSPG
jgi:hypothetical protein